MGFLKHLARWALALTLSLTVAWVVAFWQANRAADMVPLAEREAHFQRAVAWLKSNEPAVLADGNAALWWMVQTAAERTQDAYLLALVKESVRRSYPEDRPAPIWKRMIYPDAQVVPLASQDIDQLDDYRRFFLHALGCQSLPMSQGDTSRFLQENVCRPILFKVWPRDPVCSTHHAMGLLLIKRVGCPQPAESTQVANAVLDDIAFQARYDFLMRDAYMQHVLMLMWQRGADAVKPIWLRRVLTEQQADGGWQGHKRYPFLPEGLQPYGVRRFLEMWWPSRFTPDAESLDFHATAQGLLLLALSLPPQTKPQIGVPAN
jgi:hypothetical protein